MRLFVDCDDTLVLWSDSSRKVNQDKELWVREKYEINDELVMQIENFLDHHSNYSLVVWSGGGLGYAYRFAREAFEPLMRKFIILPKEMQLPAPGDVCIDDMAIVPKMPGVQVLTAMPFCPVCGEDEDD